MTARVDRDALAAVYSGGADVYDAIWSPVILPAAVVVATRLHLLDASRVLDVGAGTGALTDALRASAPRALVVSVEPSAEMLEVGRRRRRALAVRAGATVLPFGDATADAVVLAYVLFHLDDPGAALREAGRVLRPGGRVGTVTWAREEPPRAWKVWDETVDELGVPTLPPHGVHTGLDSERSIRSLLASNGLSPTNVWRERLEHTVTPGQFLELRACSGCNRARLARLDAASRRAVVDSVRARLAKLQPADFTFRADVICSTSTR